MEVSCHCNNVKIEVERPATVTQCNCSICGRYKTLWGYYEAGQPNIDIGAKGVHSYSWGDEEIDFIRCATCGCVTHYETKPGQPNPRTAINFGLARDAAADIPVKFFNGAQEL